MAANRLESTRLFISADSQSPTYWPASVNSTLAGLTRGAPSTDDSSTTRSITWPAPRPLTTANEVKANSTVISTTAT
ncbi:hypothetical protein D9M68_958850 [compost metagenome]